MKQFNGYQEAKESAQYAATEKLAPGAYICKVMNVKYETTDWGDRINIQFDICEGEKKDFFKNQYNNSTDENKKWKGVARVFVPKDDGSEADSWSKKAFARWTNAFEASNDGYTWDWDETKWKGKKVGIIFRHVGTVIDGREVVYSEANAACSVADVKSGSWYKGFSDFKAKNGYTGNGSNTSTKNETPDFMEIPEDAETEIPF